MEEDDIILTQNFLRWYKSAPESTIIFKKLFEIKRYIDQAECIEDSAINHIVEIQGDFWGILLISFFLDMSFASIFSKYKKLAFLVCGHCMSWREFFFH